MQAIRTRYLPPTNFKLARMVAQCEAKRIVISCEDGWGTDLNHFRAASALCSKLGWSGGLVSGVFAGDYYWVFEAKKAE